MTRHSAREPWRPTPAYARAIAVPVIVTAVALVLGRVELFLLGVPLALGVAVAHGRYTPLARAWSGDPARSDPPAIRVTGPSAVDSGRQVRLATTIAPSDAQIASLVLPPSIQDGEGERVAVLPPARGSAERQIVTGIEITTWGTHTLSRPDHLIAAADALLVAGPIQAEPFVTRVLPDVSARLPSGPLPPRPAGMVGAHRTRRPGEGMELHEISPFVPGDRLRRVDWRVTSRQSGPEERLFTRRTLVDADADVMCCLDNRFDLTSTVAQWSEVTEVSPQAPGSRIARSSIDIAVDAVSSVAATYIAHGDRVGMLDLAAPNTMVRPGSGSRHLLRIRNHLAWRTRRPSAGEVARLASRVPAFPPGAIIVITSVFLDDAITELAAGWRRAGHPVLAVDVMPSELTVDRENPAMGLALRIVMAERFERLAALRGHGVAVTPADPGLLALNLARLARAPRRSRHR